MRLTPMLASTWLAFVPFGQATAQERPGEKPRYEAGRYFTRPIDLWNAGLSYDPAPRPSGEAEPLPSRVAVRESIWAQPIRTPDGSWMIYAPPKPVLNFLESPSEETAKAYLSWKQEQTDKLKKAMTLLARVREPGAAGPAPLAEVPAVPGGNKSLAHDPPFRITYFKKPSCPHCVSQDAVLAQWQKRRPGGTVDIVLPGDRPELWKAYGVRGTPTLVVEVGIGSRDRKEILVGLQSEEALEAVLARLALESDGTSGQPQKEIAR
jgi:glutaredoxin